MTEMRLILHDFWRSSSAWRVRIALNLKGVNYTRALHDLLAGEHRSDAYLALAPQGLVPALVAGDVVLTQSLAIIEWLDERFPDPPLLPADAEGRAIVRGMAGLIASDVQPLQNVRVLKALKRRFGADQEATDDWARHWIAEGFAALETLVTRHGRGYCYGDTPSLADCLLVPQMGRAEQFRIALSRFPALNAVREHCEALPAFAAAQPAAQPEASPP
jgi:maleylpyruvate isomerase